MSSLAAASMLFATICAAACVLIDRCRTIAGLVCSVVMVFGMLDVTYLHILSPTLLSISMVLSGTWAAFVGWNKQHDISEKFFRVHRAVSAVVMAWLLSQHAEAMATNALLGEICSTGERSVNMHRGLVMVAPEMMAAVVLLVLGMILMLRRWNSDNAVSANAVAFEPAFMGLSLIFMAI